MLAGKSVLLLWALQGSPKGARVHVETRRLFGCERAADWLKVFHGEPERTAGLWEDFCALMFIGCARVAESEQKAGKSEQKRAEERENEGEKEKEKR